MPKFFKPHDTNSYYRAFTLVEIMVVISIIGLLSSIIITNLRSVRDKAIMAGAIKFATHTYRGLGADALLHLSFDDASNLAKDYSQYNRTTALNGSITSGSEGTFGPYAVFDGFTTSIDVSINAGSDFLLGSKTISLWIYPENNNSVIFHTGSGTLGMTNQIMRISDINQISVWPPDSANSNTTLALNRWSHIALVPKDNTFFLYINGKLVEKKIVNYYVFPNTAGILIKIGARIDFGLTTSYFKGKMDEFIIYNKQITASEVWDLYASQAPKFGIAVNPNDAPKL